MVNLLPGSSPSDTSELWPVLAGGRLLLPVLLTVTTGSTVGTSTFTGATDVRGAGRTNGLFVGSGDNFSGEVEPEKMIEYFRIFGYVCKRECKRTIHGGTQHPRGSKRSSTIATRIGS